ncbi:hypothetical protein RRG08_053558 [Elysia crispata]|uniref:Uncharacterized protein n=1 Tax=Elysia crispata TaxID=231223 RepID=A0AAE0Y289_9GAST|nr:hypothetical protein RRG08_053558 [Elysia crispata]
MKERQIAASGSVESRRVLILVSSYLSAWACGLVSQDLPAGARSASQEMETAARDREHPRGTTQTRLELKQTIP